jgi:hypothetical protein
MRNSFWFGFLPHVLGGILFAGPISLQLIPGSQQVTAGHAVSTEVDIGGLGLPPSVGAFDLSVSYDTSLLSFTSVNFGSLLGDVDMFEALTTSNLSHGVIEFAEVSLLTPAELDTLQVSNFSLATLTFQALNSGGAGFSFVTGVVDDAFGNKLTEIPEPRTLFLVGSMLAVLVACWVFISGKTMIKLLAFRRLKPLVTRRRHDEFEMAYCWRSFVCLHLVLPRGPS